MRDEPSIHTQRVFTGVVWLASAAIAATALQDVGLAPAVWIGVSLAALPVLVAAAYAFGWLAERATGLVEVVQR